MAGSIGGVPNSMFGSEVPPASLPPYLVPTGMNSYPGQTVPHSAPPTGGVAPNQQIMKDSKCWRFEWGLVGKGGFLHVHNSALNNDNLLYFLLIL